MIGEKLMHFPSELPSASDFSFQIAQGLSFKFWMEENEEFKPVSYEGDQKDLVYMLISDSSDGFGIILFRNLGRNALIRSTFSSPLIFRCHS